MRSWLRFLIIGAAVFCGVLLMLWASPKRSKSPQVTPVRTKTVSSAILVSPVRQEVACDEARVMPQQLTEEDRHEILNIVAHLHGVDKTVISVVAISTNAQVEARVRLPNAMVFLKKTAQGQWQLQKAMEVRF